MQFPKRYVLYVCIALALFLRIMLIGNPGFEADISFWKSWGLATDDKGIIEGMKVTNNNYPTPFAYVLGGMVALYSLFADPHNFNQFWSNTNLLFLAISKLFPILADFGIAGIILYIGKHAASLGFPTANPRGRGALTPGVIRNAKRFSFPLIPDSVFMILAITYLLNPIALIDGAWWGQVDSLGLFVFLCALILALKRRPFWAGLVFIISMMTKLQNMIYGPVFFLFIWQLEGYDGLILSLAGALTGFLGLNIEFFLTRNMDRVLASLTENYDYFPWMSLNAFNLWWIVAGAKGMATSDKLSILGIVNAKTIGLLTFSSFYLFAVVQQLFTRAGRGNMFAGRFPSLAASASDRQKTKKSKDTMEGSEVLRAADQEHGATTGALSHLLYSFLTSLILVNAAFFLFQTQSHDRYAYPLSVFLLLWAPLYLYQVSGIRYQGTRYRFPLFIIFYSCFSLIYFYNLHTALVFNYPNNGLPVLSLLTQPIFTIATAYVLLGLFFVFLFAVLRASKMTRMAALVVLVVFVSGLCYLNKPLWSKQPVSLTKIVPYISEQAYGTRQTDKSVQSSFGGPNKWTRLSVQYVFYHHGIGTHANSKHVFDINKQFTKFTTDFGIDTEAGTKASAIFEIYGDGKLLFRSPKMGRFDLPKHAEVNITGVKYLSLVTNDAGDGNYDDHTDWLDPLLWP